MKMLNLPKNFFIKKQPDRRHSPIRKQGVLLNPKTENYGHLDEESQKLVKKTIDFFEQRGKAQLKEDDHERLWYADFFCRLLRKKNYSRPF